MGFSLRHRQLQVDLVLLFARNMWKKKVTSQKEVGNHRGFAQVCHDSSILYNLPGLADF